MRCHGRDQQRHGFQPQSADPIGASRITVQSFDRIGQFADPRDGFVEMELFQIAGNAVDRLMDGFEDFLCA